MYCVYFLFMYITYIVYRYGGFAASELAGDGAGAVPAVGPGSEEYNKSMHLIYNCMIGYG